MNFDVVIEKLMQHFTGPSFKDEVEAAKREFFERAGTFDEQAADFEMKMAQFSDWYLFVRKNQKNHMTPLQLVLKGAAMANSEISPLVFEKLQDSLHSIFEFVKVRGEDVHIRDLFSRQKYVIKKSPVTEGFNRDEVFEARLIPTDENYVFSNTFCFHPPKVTKIILQEIQNVLRLPQEEQTAARENLIIRLHKMRYKTEQYRHVDVCDIYSNEAKLRM